MYMKLKIDIGGLWGKPKQTKEVYCKLTACQIRTLSMYGQIEIDGLVFYID